MFCWERRSYRKYTCQNTLTLSAQPIWMRLNWPSFFHSKPHRHPRIENWQSMLHQAVHSQGFLILKLEEAIWTQNNWLWVPQPLYPNTLNEINKHLFLSNLKVFVNCSCHATLSHKCADSVLTEPSSSLSHPLQLTGNCLYSPPSLVFLFVAFFSSLTSEKEKKKPLSYKIKQSILVARRENISLEKLELKGQNLLMSFQAQSS